MSAESKIPTFVISLDLELFWGVADSRTISDYRNNVEGEWLAIPRLLEMFRQFDVAATWATVGMIMCKDHAQWIEMHPSIQPTYLRKTVSSYSLGSAAREHPRLFFGRPLIERILAMPNQEIGSHSFSHLFCGEIGVTLEQFAADLVCAKRIAADIGVNYQSFVFPRNQIRSAFLSELRNSGFVVYRGNPKHWLYQDGHQAPGGLAGRALRLADAWIPLTGTHTSQPINRDGLTNIAASVFLRPWSRTLSTFESLRLNRIRNAMTAAARSRGVFHLWWHPHNFGVNVEQNIDVLRSILQHYVVLRDQYGMRSLTMADSARSTLSSVPAVNHKH